MSKQLHSTHAELFVTPDEIRRTLRLSKNAVCKLLNGPDAPTIVRISPRRMLVRRADFTAWLDSRTRHAAA